MKVEDDAERLCMKPCYADAEKKKKKKKKGIGTGLRLHL